MTENKGDLISREALKEKLNKKALDLANGGMIFIESINHIIDNAPTVELCYQTTSCLDCKMYDKEKHNCPRFCEVIRSAIEEKPQGEWIDIDSRVSKAMCSNCKNIIITEPFGKPNYCPNCGAKMEVKKDENRNT